MKILSISQCDFANFQYDNMKALRSVGLECDSVVMERHPFYEEQSEVKSIAEVRLMIEKYDVIQFFHDNVQLYVNLLPFMCDKRIFAYHTSSYYRKNSAYVNEGMCEAEKHICAMPEFMAMCPGAVYMVGAIDTDKIKPTGHDPACRYGHYPSNSKVKGTENILLVFEQINEALVYNTNPVSYNEQLMRLDNCDIYIEMLTTKDGLGSAYGNFGITALEAAALGKVVITQCNDIEVYNNAYGFCGLNIANTSEKLKRLIKTFSNYSEDFIKGQQQITREWVVKNHSYKATGEYFLKNVL